MPEGPAGRAPGKADGFDKDGGTGGPNLPFPYSSQVRGKLRELRTQQGKDRLRVLYFGDARRVFVLLHGMVKRSAQLPEEDIRVAQARMERHEQPKERRTK